MAASTIVKHFTDGKLTLEDGTGVPVTLEVPFSNGDFSLSGLNEGLKEVKAYYARGVLTSLRKGQDVEPTGSFTAQLADISDATDNTAIDFILKQGSYSGNASTSSGDVYTVNLTWTVEGTDYGDAADHTIKCNDCAVTLDVSEGEPDSISFNFTVYGTIEMT